MKPRRARCRLRRRCSPPISRALGDAVAPAERGGADLIHFDVMDGHFVPNITIGPPVVKSLRARRARAARRAPDDREPGSLRRGVRRGGRGEHHGPRRGGGPPAPDVHLIKSLGVKAGVALNPATPVTALEEIAGDVDYVLVMTVNPGLRRPDFHPAVGV